MLTQWHLLHSTEPVKGRQQRLMRTPHFRQKPKSGAVFPVCESNFRTKSVCEPKFRAIMAYPHERATVENYKLKMRIGDHEFDAEGPGDIVQAQFAVFRELVEAAAKTPAPTPTVVTAAESTPPSAKNGELMLDKIMRMEGRVVSLTARGSSLEQEIFLLMLGQRNLRNSDSVSGAEILDGLRLTGRTVSRIDYQLDKMTDAGDVITVGSNRGRRYRLTNRGFAKAQELAMDLVATVA